MKSLTVHYTLEHTVCGVLLILGGVFSFLFERLENAILGGLSVISILAYIILILWLDFSRTEKSDEMSKAHLQKSNARGYFTVRYLMFCLLMLISLNKLFNWNVELDIETILILMLGIGEVVVGLKFYKLERDGD